jgi:hypothetical protein
MTSKYQNRCGVEELRLIATEVVYDLCEIRITQRKETYLPHYISHVSKECGTLINVLKISSVISIQTLEKDEAINSLPCGDESNFHAYSRPCMLTSTASFAFLIHTITTSS